MAKLPVDLSSGEYTNFARAQAIIPGRSLANISFTGTATDSETFSTGVNLLKLSPTQDCWICFDIDHPVAIVDDRRSNFLFGGVVHFVGIPTGATKFSVIRNTVSGTMYITQGRAS